MRTRLFFTAVVTALCVAVLSTALALAADEVNVASRDEQDAQIAELIEQLGDPQYAVRERAQRELKQLGFAAFDALTEAENSDDVEVAAQAKYLVRSIRVEWTSDRDPPEIREILAGYEFEDPNARLGRIKQLAEMPNDQGLQWLCRLARFEQSPLLAKQAAMTIITQESPPTPDAWPARAKTITGAMQRSSRPTAKWLRAYVQAHDDPEGAAKAWDALAEAERQTLAQHPQETSTELVMALLRQETALFDRLERPDAAVDVIRKMVQVERGEQESLAELIDWLVKRQAWSAIDDVYERFATSIDLDPLLLYTLAQARLAQGKRDDGEELAKKALAIDRDRPDKHFNMARALRRRGLLEWSDREYRHVIQIATPVAPEYAAVIRLEFSESLHDRDLDDEAAKMLNGVVDQLEKNRSISALIERAGRTPEAVQSRMKYFYACAAARKGDHDAQIKLLDEAIQVDPNDADVLIGLYRLPNQDAERRERTKEQIKQAVDAARAEIEQNPEIADTYNQFAWIVCNTEGDLDEALRMSEKSVGLKRSPAYLDTLAHCYFAKGDYENALRYQLEASRHDPYSKQISTQLDVVREAIAKQNREGG